MNNIIKINQTQNLKFKDNEFKAITKSNDRLKSTGELITDYVTSCINNFNNEFTHARNDREFIFVFDDYSHLDSFLEAKDKMELFSYKFNTENEFNFIVDLFKYFKHVETKLLLAIKPKNKDCFTYKYDFGELFFTFKLYPDSRAKLFRLDYKGNKLVEFTEYMDFNIKIVEHVHPIFSTYDIRMKGKEYTNAIDWLLELEEYVINNM